MYLITADELKKMKNYVLLDVRFNMEDEAYGPEAYAKAHIAGAQYMNLVKDMAGPTGTHGGRHPRKNRDEFREIAVSKGVSDEKDVVIYDDGDMMMASRCWIMLQELGKDSYIVSNGYNSLIEAGFEATADLSVPERGVLNGRVKENLFKEIDDIRRAIKDGSALIVDSRSNERYLGLSEPYDGIAGHIPTAINIFWKDSLADGVLKSNVELTELFKPLENESKVIFHCGSGISGAFNIFAYNEMLKDSGVKEDVLGEKVSLYIGSFGDYVSYEGNELVTKDGIIITL